MSLALLDVHQEHLTNLSGMEDIMEYIKTEMPRLSQASAQQVFKKVRHMPALCGCDVHAMGIV